MQGDQYLSVILFDGFNEVSLPGDAVLSQVEVQGYEVSLRFRTNGVASPVYRRFYVAFNNAVTDYDQGILRLITSVAFPDGTTVAMVYEVYA